MSAKEYLQQIHRLDSEIRQHKRRIIELENEIGGLKAIDYSADRIQSTPQDRMPGGIARLVELQNELMGEVVLLQEKKRRITAEIGMIKDGSARKEDEAHVLVLRYINCLDWKTIGDEMSLTERRVQQIHGHALEDFRKLNLF